MYANSRLGIKPSNQSGKNQMKSIKLAVGFKSIHYVIFRFEFNDVNLL